jgi:hypothetical protein
MEIFMEIWRKTIVFYLKNSKRVWDLISKNIEKLLDWNVLDRRKDIRLSESPFPCLRGVCFCS